jgi:ribonuclease HI
MSKIEIYTDGACSDNPGPGAYAAILIYKNNEKIISGYKEKTTNQEVELLAALNALKAIKNPNIEINMYSDSKYVINGMLYWMHNWAEKGWIKKIYYKNTWQELYDLYAKLKVNCIWVKGHCELPINKLIGFLFRRMTTNTGVSVSRRSILRRR